MNRRTEQEITQNWKGDSVKPVVSVCCTTYNHEPYIAKAIDGFLMQETNFPFEILIRDDCSTDKTAEILKQYAGKYPQIIRPVFEKENTFSKGVKPMPQLYKIAQGKYIAICEGDDYWTHSNKLQIQVSEMRKNKELGISFHLASKLINNNLKDPSLKESNKIYTTQEIIKGDFHLVETNTVMIKKICLNNLNYELLRKSPVGDVWIRIACSIPNGALFINKIMSVYRVQSEGSWGQSMQESNKFYPFVNKMIQSIDDFDKYWEYKYKKEFIFFKNMFINALMGRNIPRDKKIFFMKRNKDVISLKNKILWIFIYKNKNKKMVFFLKKIKKSLKKWS